MLQTDTERMTVEHYTELIDLLHEKISRLEHDKDEQRKEINRLYGLVFACYGESTKSTRQTNGQETYRHHCRQVRCH